jgi:hypothetical protein
VHCPGCGLIIGKETPAEVCRCPRCAHILRLLRFHVDDGFDRRDYLPVDPSRRRFASLYLSEAMVRFTASTRSARAADWEPLLIELEEECLKSFARGLDWVIAGVHRDPGPREAESARPFARIAADLAGGLSNAILVRDFDRVPRKDLHALHDLGRARGADLYSIEPHPIDPGLRLEDIDFDAIPDAAADHRELERLWSPAAGEALAKLFAATGWHFRHYAPEVLARAIGLEAVRAWKGSDPACRDRSWRDVLSEFAIARARRRGELERLPLPELVTCSLCRRRFLDAALPRRLMELTIGRATYCGVCLGRALLAGADAGDSPADLDAIVSFFRELPRDRFQTFIRMALERLPERGDERPSEPPSNLWLAVAGELGYLDHLGGAARPDTLFKARDGHLGASLGLALLDNWVAARSLSHRPDGRYPLDPELNPASTVRADLVVGQVLVEFLGRRGGDEFKKRFESRVELGRRHGLGVVGVWAEDLVVPAVLERKLECLKPSGSDGERKEGGFP